MRLARFMAGGRARVGLVQGEELFEVLGGWRDALRRSAGPSPSRPLPLSGRRWSIADCLFLPPLPQGSRGLFCVGMNYAEHQAEAGTALATSGRSRPIFFMKTAAAMAPPYSDLSLDPEVSPEFDWEVELGVVIGRAGAKFDAGQSRRPPGGLHGCERHHSARLAAAPRAVVHREEHRPLVSDRTMGHDDRRGGIPAQIQSSTPGQRQGKAERQDGSNDPRRG